MNHPSKVAADLAAQLRADPIAASQILEHIPGEELMDLLGIRDIVNAAVDAGVAKAIEDLEWGNA